MKTFKYIEDIVIIALLVIIALGINKSISTNKAIERAKGEYNEKQKSNEATQKTADTTIKVLNKEIQDLDEDIQRLRNKRVLPSVVVKWKTKWKTKVVDKVEYITVPVGNLDSILKENVLCTKLVAAWKKVSREWEQKYTSEAETHEKAKEYIKALEGKKHRFSLGIGAIAGTNGLAVGVYFGYNILTF